MVGQAITPLESALTFDLTPLIDAYINLAGLRLHVTLPEIYSQYISMLSGQRSAWQANFYGDDFYDGRPGSHPPALMPDSMQGVHDPFREMTMPEVQMVLDRLGITYMHRGRMVHAPIVEVW